MKTIKDLEKLLSKFKNNYKNRILIRYIHDEIDEIEKEISYLQKNTILINDEHLAIVTNNFDEFIANNSDEEIENLIEENIETIALKLVKFLLEILCEVKYSKLNNTNIDEKIAEELLRIKIIKEKEFITMDELEEIFGLKKDKVLELRTNKELKYFQMGDKEKVLFNKLKYEGKIFDSNNSGKLVVTEYRNSKNVIVEFLRTGYVTKCDLDKILLGKLKDKLAPSVYGVGVVGVQSIRSDGKGRVSVLPGRTAAAAYPFCHRRYMRVLLLWYWKIRIQLQGLLRISVCQTN